MKEIGKLIELLNEYKKTRVKEYWIEFNIWEEKGELHIIIDDGQDNYSGGTCDTDTADTYVISKKFGFIKWLVDNDKIDRDKKEIEKSDYDITFTGALTKDKKSDLDIMVDTLLMLLSISSSPIEDLISYLK